MIRKLAIRECEYSNMTCHSHKEYLKFKKMFDITMAAIEPLLTKSKIFDYVYPYHNYTRAKIYIFREIWRYLDYHRIRSDIYIDFDPRDADLPNLINRINDTVKYVNENIKSAFNADEKFISLIYNDKNGDILPSYLSTGII